MHSVYLGINGAIQAYSRLTKGNSDDGAKLCDLRPRCLCGVVTTAIRDLSLEPVPRPLHAPSARAGFPLDTAVAAFTPSLVRVAEAHFTILRARRMLTLMYFGIE